MEQAAPDHLLRVVRRIVVATGILAVALALGGAAWLFWRVHVCLPQLDGTIRVGGLTGSVEILRDARGVPHLRAQSQQDLLFAQGYVTAQDRLWQMDLSRRLAQGGLSEIFGEPTLKFDIENRTLGLRQAGERAVQELGPDSLKMLAAYARGVNAFISTHQDRLPIEFLMLRYRPRPWREADCFAVALNMSEQLSHTWPDELMRERIRTRVSPELYKDLFPDHSPLDRPVAEAPDAPSRPPSHAQAVRSSAAEGLEPVLAALVAPLESSLPSLGSNNWVVSGAHTQSGKPLLANDPHLSHGIPSVWYMIHLQAPGLNATGSAYPAFLRSSSATMSGSPGERQILGRTFRTCTSKVIISATQRSISTTRVGSMPQSAKR